MTIPRSDLRTAIIVHTACKVCDATGDYVRARRLLTKYVSGSVIERVLFQPKNRRMM
jgi:hypothetical protein